MEQNRFASLDALRALAALAVCFFHFDSDSYVGLWWWSAFAGKGHLGVDIFFVVSGFIIPLTLIRTGYRLREIGSFLVARFIRLYPAYFLAGLSVMGFWYFRAMAAGFRGSPPSYTASQIVGNLFLVCSFTGQSWVIPVFWTLAIEAQFYLVLGLSLGGLSSRSKGVRLVILGLWIAAPLLVGSGPTVFSWTALFAFGLIGCMLKVNLLSSLESGALVLAAFVAHALVRGGLSAGVGLLALLCIIVAPNIQSRVFVWIGSISYSLYLVHVPIGQRVFNLAGRFTIPTAARIGVVVIAIAISIIGAALFFRFVEAPSHALSRKVRSAIKARFSREPVRDIR